MLGTTRSRRFAAISAFSIVLVAAAAGALWHLAGRAPAFYHQVDRLPADERKAESKQFVRRSADLWNEIENESTWTGKIPELEVNSWLSADFAAKHPYVLPDGIRDPRVSFDKGRIGLAFRMERGPLETVVSVFGRVWLAEPNVLAVEFEQVRAGAIPLPPSQLMETLSSAAESADLDLEWRQHAGHLVALLRLWADGGDVELERLEVEPGVLYLGGRSRRNPQGAQPATAGRLGSSGVSLNVQLPDSPFAR